MKVNQNILTKKQQSFKRYFPKTSFEDSDSSSSHCKAVVKLGDCTIVTTISK